MANNKEQNLLWSRSAGRCSVCREVLTRDLADGDSIILGEMCHIVGKNKGSARYDSVLTDKERKSYSNLILMCPTHHRIIDKSEGEFTVEKLKQLKEKHEVWVSECLSKRNPDSDEVVYSDFIDTITIMLKLEEWDAFIDGAVRNIIHYDFVASQYVLNEKLLKTIWPTRKDKLKGVIVELIGAFDRFMTNYLGNVEVRGEYFCPNLAYKRIPNNPNFSNLEKEEGIWSDTNCWLLCDYVNKLNNYASSVRQFSNPLYFLKMGKFLLIDSLGYRFDGESTSFDPAGVDIVKKLDGLGYKTTIGIMLKITT